MKRKRKTTTRRITKKKRSPTPQSTTTIASLADPDDLVLVPSLPDDLVLVIVARVPRLYYPTLSLVSKRFRSLVASPELYKVRSLLGHTESCLYVCLELGLNKKVSWFTLCRKPDQTTLNSKRSAYISRKKEESSGYVLARVSISDSPCSNSAGLVAVGSDIYNVADIYTIRERCVSLSVMDCQSHTWRKAPSLRVKLLTLSASVLDRKIYVAGNYKARDTERNMLENSVEVFDIDTQMWASVPIPCHFKVQRLPICLLQKHMY
ncbi:PREDICTED: F-box/kelch-repeat protein At5g51250-like [Camelina sativa]|uniref:F-box/kelch-repeat protein At5g51250-like n=1 Tax=Camelina sativa TaxID=90675 RepID=A0ABM1RAV2_CAMSA|nr:PREDICTED: F-box/kelch-repeat protein At5g51250-like [Camelina sativa]